MRCLVFYNHTGTSVSKLIMCNLLITKDIKFITSQHCVSEAADVNEKKMTLLIPPDSSAAYTG